MADPNRFKVLVISHLYPYQALGMGWGNLGTFVRDQLKALHNICDLQVVIPLDCIPRREHCRPSQFRKWWSQVSRSPKKFTDDGIDLDIVRFAAPLPRRHFLFGYGVAALLPVLQRARTIRRRFPFDIIHAHTTVPDGIVATWLGTIFRVPTVITSHQGDVELVPSNRWNRATLRYALTHADRVIAVSSSLKNTIASLGIPESKIKTIPNGFDPAKFSVNGNGNATVKGTTSEKVILFLGQLVNRKDPLILVQALGQVRKRLPHVRVVIVGDGPLKKQIEDRIRHLRLTECVDLIGEIPHSIVPSYIRAADLLCLPSHAEGWPTVIFEALSQGVPIVASRVGGIPEAICSPDFGLLVEPGDLQGLTEALYRGLTKSWNDAKIRKYSNEFTWEKIAARLHEEYQSLTGQKRTSVSKAAVESIELPNA